MTTTEIRPAAQQPWPSRREREGVRTRGRHAAPVTAAPAAAPVVPAVAAPSPAARVLDPGVTTRLPVVAPRPAAERSEGHPSAARAAIYTAERSEGHPSAARAAISTAAPVPAPFRPAAPSTRPPRPAVGSGVRTDLGHRTDGRIRSPRNGAGLAALCLGLVGVPFALTPVTSFLAAGLGVLACTFGVAGWSRVRARTATNRGPAVTGALLGLVALLLGALGTVAFFQDPSRVVYDVDALTSSIHSIGE